MKMAGIDVHKKVLMVVVIETTSAEEKPERRQFTTLPGDLSRLSSWLRAQDGQEAVMESTAQYWRTVCFGIGAAYAPAFGPCLLQPCTTGTQT